MACYALEQVKSVNSFGFSGDPHLSSSLKVLKQDNQANWGTQRPNLSMTFYALKHGESKDEEFNNGKFC